jgi:hypothetical protein
MAGLPEFSPPHPRCATLKRYFGLKSGDGPNARVVPKMALAINRHFPAKISGVKDYTLAGASNVAFGATLSRTCFNL